MDVPRKQIEDAEGDAGTKGRGDAGTRRHRGFFHSVSHFLGLLLSPRPRVSMSPRLLPAHLKNLGLAAAIITSSSFPSSPISLAFS